MVSAAVRFDPSAEPNYTCDFIATDAQPVDDEGPNQKGACKLLFAALINPRLP
jgi:hypothetical protein